MKALDRKQHLYLWLGGLFVAALLTGDFIGGRLFRLAGHDFSAGMLAFPLTFLLTDVVNEFYGPKATRRLTFVGLGAAAFAFLVINIALALPVSPESPLSDAAFRSTFGASSRIYIASMVAYVVGQMLDIAVFQAFRKITKHRLLWARATGSTLISQASDTLIVTFIFLGGTKSAGFILGVARDSYVVKLVAAVALTPLIYGLHALFGRLLSIDESPAT